MVPAAAWEHTQGKTPCSRTAGQNGRLYLGKEKVFQEGNAGEEGDDSFGAVPEDGEREKLPVALQRTVRPGVWKEGDPRTLTTEVTLSVGWVEMRGL